MSKMSHNATNGDARSEKRPENNTAPANDRIELSHGGSNLPKQPGVKSDDAYEAPLVDGSNEDCPKIPGSYHVMLRPGRSVAQHLKNVGFEIPPTGGHFFYANEDSGYYVAHLTDEQLAAVRRDPGVKVVGFNTYGIDEDSDESDINDTNEG